MTREEAMNILDDYDVNFDGHSAEEIAEAFDMAFKALEQEPCEDAISRQDLDKALYERFHEEDIPNNITDVRLGDVRNFIKNFPSVTPQSKIGRWIETGYTIINSGGQIIHEVICSECSGIAYFRKSFEGKYVGAKICSNCGAKMQEVKE